jgi:thiol-disulfide isomerase/thioredoxin
MRLQLLFYISATTIDNAEVFSKGVEHLESLDGDSYNTGIISIFSTMELKNLLQCDDSEASNWICKETSSKDVSDSTTENKTERKDHLFILEFVAEWCGLCKSIRPLVDVCYK